MSNPNNCATCDHKKHPDGGHCYMFKDAPKQVCKQHTPPHFIARQWVSRNVSMQLPCNGAHPTVMVLSLGKLKLWNLSKNISELTK